MENALYYTLSTVSQTLAGALGMLAAFLALRVSALDSSIRARIGELDDRTHLNLRLPSGSNADTIEMYRQFVKQHPQGRGFEEQLLTQLDHVQASRARLLRETRGAFIVSASVMSACFVGLAASPWLAGCVGRWLPVFVSAIAGGVSCLIWFGRIVRDALE